MKKYSNPESLLISYLDEVLFKLGFKPNNRQRTEYRLFGREWSIQVYLQEMRFSLFSLHSNSKHFEYGLRRDDGISTLICLTQLLQAGYSLKDFNFAPKDLSLFSCQDMSFFINDDDALNDWIVHTAIQRDDNRINLSFSASLSFGTLLMNPFVGKNHLKDSNLFFNRISPLCMDEKDVQDSMVEGLQISEGRVYRYSGQSKLLVLPEGITTIMPFAFSDADTLEKVVLPSSLRILGGGAFYRCRSLESVELPPNLIDVGSNPFTGCPKITLTSHSPLFPVIDGVLYSSTGCLISYPPKREDSHFSIPEKVSALGDSAFEDATHLQVLEIPSSVERVFGNPLMGCSHLEVISHSKDVRIVEDGLYESVYQKLVCLLPRHIGDFKVLAGTKSIGNYAFAECPQLKKVILPESLITLGVEPFKGDRNYSLQSGCKEYPVSDGVLYHSQNNSLIACPRDKAIGEFKVPFSINSLAPGAFEGCDALTQIVLENVALIGPEAFRGCTSLTRLHFADWVTSIGDRAFAGCTSLKEVSLSKRTELGEDVFSQCSENLLIREEFEDVTSDSSLEDIIKNMELFRPQDFDLIHVDFRSPEKEGRTEENASRDSTPVEPKIISLSFLLSSGGVLSCRVDPSTQKSVLRCCQRIFGRKNTLLIKGHSQILFAKESVILCQSSLSKYRKTGKKPKITLEMMKKQFQKKIGASLKENWYQSYVDTLSRLFTHSFSSIMLVGKNDTLSMAIATRNQEDKGKRTILSLV
jgi:hypothetical protein